MPMLPRPTFSRPSTMVMMAARSSVVRMVDMPPVVDGAGSVCPATDAHREDAAAAFEVAILVAALRASTSPCLPARRFLRARPPGVLRRVVANHSTSRPITTSDEPPLRFQPTRRYAMISEEWPVACACLSTWPTSISTSILFDRSILYMNYYAANGLQGP